MHPIAPSWLRAWIDKSRLLSSWSTNRSAQFSYSLSYLLISSRIPALIMFFLSHPFRHFFGTNFWAKKAEKRIGPTVVILVHLCNARVWISQYLTLIVREKGRKSSQFFVEKTAAARWPNATRTRRQPGPIWKKCQKTRQILRQPIVAWHLARWLNHFFRVKEIWCAIYWSGMSWKRINAETLYAEHFFRLLPKMCSHLFKYTLNPCATTRQKIAYVSKMPDMDRY